MPADIGHGIDRRRAADDAAARAFEAAAAGGRLGFGEIHPVVLAVEQQMRPAERDFDPGIAVPAAGLEQQHPRAFVLAEPGSHRAAGGTGADDDDVVVFIGGHSLNLCRKLSQCGDGLSMTNAGRPALKSAHPSSLRRGKCPAAVGPPHLTAVAALAGTGRTAGRWRGGRGYEAGIGLKDF